MAEVKLVDVCKVYKGSVKAVKEFNLDISDGEFLVLVGPSGCGKSTTLRMIAGLETITSGKVYIGDSLVNGLEPKDRDIAMVFQNYALYPHLSVFDNLAYSLNCHHENKKVIKERVEEVAKMLDIEQYLLRKPKELSGGQRQRVALGRCLIRNPKVFLFDEPLSNLDAKLRVSMRSEISKLHKRIHGTFIYVTHDQTEAMTMGDRIVVMKDGIIQQVDTPVNLYEHPCNVFVATFLGSPQMNIYQAHLNEKSIQLGDNLEISLSEKVQNKLMAGYQGKDIYLGIRPSDFSLGSKEDYDIYVPHIELTERLGNETLIYFQMEGKEGSALASLKLDITDDLSEDIYLKIDKDKLHLFNLEEESILKTNDVNYLPVEVKVVEDKAYLNEKYLFPDYSAKYIAESQETNYQGFVAVSSKDFTLEKETEIDIPVVAKIKAYDVYSDKKVYFASPSYDETVRLTFYQSRQSNLKNGDSVTLYINPTKVDICDKNQTKLTVRETVNHPIRNVEINKIGKDYYLFERDQAFAKHKFFMIEKIFDLNNEMILIVKDEKKKEYSFRTEKNTMFYVGLVLYVKYVK